MRTEEADPSETADPGVKESAKSGDELPILMVERIYDALQSAIVEARLGAGTALSQNKLAAQLGVSRTPVREALLRLEHDGLVQRSAGLGFVVATITPEEVNEACDLLKVLDRFVYVHASRKMTTDELNELLDLARSMVESAERGDTDMWRRQDLRYHGIVMTAADNRYVAEYLEQTRRRVQRFWLNNPQLDGRLTSCSQDHASLAQAMVDCDEESLTVAVDAHIERLREGVLIRLENARPLLPHLEPLSTVILSPVPAQES
jgi:DNA-binding GntR family transcriptional regulator